MRIGTARAGALALGLAMFAGAAAAHSPYLLPNAFDATRRDHVTVQGSFTEHFFVPDVVMKSDDFHVVGPDGHAAALTPTYFRDLAVMEAATPVDGTYRITSGARAGRMSKVVFKNDKWEFIEPGKPAPADAVDMQSITTAEVYVSRGAPSAAALAPVGKGLEFHALTHPNKIGAGEAARFELLLDGKPLPGQTIEVHREGSDADGGCPLEAKTDAAGIFTIQAPQPGAYLAMTRYRIAPAGGRPGQSLTYALSFEVLP